MRLCAWCRRTTERCVCGQPSKNKPHATKRWFSVKKRPGFPKRREEPTVAELVEACYK